MIEYNDKTVNIIKLLQVWRDTFEEKIEGKDWYYNHVNKDRDEDTLLKNLRVNAEDVIYDLFECGDIPHNADIYEDE
jgi:hypothetical protein